MKNIIISEQTLKRTAEERTVPLLFREKNALARETELLGADRIELAPVTSFKEDRIICSTIASAVKEMTVCIPVGIDAASIENAWNCIKNAAKPCLQIELPVSTLKMEYTYHLKDRKMLDKAVDLIRTAKQFCDEIEFSALDATRADIDFVIEICRAAVDAGATAISVCDETGAMLPEDTALFISRIRKNISVPLFAGLSDELDLGCANAAAAVRAGADGIKCSCSSAKTVSTDKFARFLAAKGEELGLSSHLNTLKIHRDIAAMLNNINRNDHTQAQSDEKDTIYLDSDSTAADLGSAAVKLGYELSEEDIGLVLKALKQVCERKSTVGQKELEALIASYAMQAPSQYHLKSYVANCGNITTSMANVILLCEGQEISGVSTGDGPIDAAFRAIEQSIGYHYELDDFQIQAVTEGKEALGSALVKLRSNGKLYSGNGISTDIVGASIRAYINALNKIVYEENGK